MFYIILEPYKGKGGWVVRNVNAIYFFIFTIHLFYIHSTKGYDGEGRFKGDVGGSPRKVLGAHSNSRMRVGRGWVARKVGMASTRRQTYIQRREGGWGLQWVAKEGERVFVASNMCSAS